MMLLAGFDVHLRRRDRAPPHLLGGQLPPGKRQAAQFLLEASEFHAGVDERPEHHVATDAGKAVEIRCFHMVPHLPTRHRLGRRKAGKTKMVVCAPGGVK